MISMSMHNFNEQLNTYILFQVSLYPFMLYTLMNRDLKVACKESA